MCSTEQVFQYNQYHYKWTVYKLHIHILICKREKKKKSKYITHKQDGMCNKEYYETSCIKFLYKIFDFIITDLIVKYIQQYSNNIL